LRLIDNVFKRTAVLFVFSRRKCKVVDARSKIAIALALLIAAGVCCAASAEENPSIAYRRIFVPAEHVETWPTEGQKYLPVESRDFERWVKAANESENEREQRAAITSAEYFAKFEGDRLIGGRGTWTVELRGEQPAFLPLHGISIDVREARWRDAPQLPVRLGMWGKSGHLATREGLEVSRSGVLEFRWSAIRGDSQWDRDTMAIAGSTNSTANS
jgi:hypothetical protein